MKTVQSIRIQTTNSTATVINDKSTRHGTVASSLQSGKSYILYLYANQTRAIYASKTNVLADIENDSSNILLLGNSYYEQRILIVAPDKNVYPYLYFQGSNGTKPAFYFYDTETIWFESDGAKAGVSRSGTFANVPASSDIYVGFEYFCTDKQTVEGTTDGIMIYHKGNNVWVDALGRVIS